MESQELEFSITQYLDGTLPQRAAAKLEQRLAVDSTARELLESYQQLDSVLNGARRMPQIQWGLLSERISRAIDEETTQAVSHKWPRAWVGAGMALAACVLIVTGVWSFTSRTVAPQNISSGIAPVAVVIGPEVEAPTGQTGAQVTLTSMSNTSAASEVDQPSHIYIASATLH